MYAMTVALPMYRCRSIGWLALESLCRQVDIDFEWELIIMEEAGVNAGILGFDPMGRGTIMAYKARLKEVGCTSIQYVPLKEWLPLSEKWVQMGRLAQSEDFLLLGADDYAPPDRLSLTRNALKSGAKWAYSDISPFYEIFSESFCIYRQDASDKVKTGVNMSIKTAVVKQIPMGQIVRFHVDSWIYGWFERLSDELTVNRIEGISWRNGVCTTGLNQISGERGYLMAHYQGPFHRPVAGEPSGLLDCVPVDVANKLKALKNEEASNTDFLGSPHKPFVKTKTRVKPKTGWGTIRPGYSKRNRRREK